MTKSDDGTAEFEPQERLRSREKHRQQRLLTFCLAGLAVVLLLNLIPGLGELFAAISFSLAAMFLILMTLLIAAGTHERYRATSRIPTGSDDTAEHA